MSKKKAKTGPKPAEAPLPSYRNLIAVLLIVICAVTFIAYARSLSCGFTNWDDNEYTWYNYQQLQKFKTSFWDGFASFFFVPDGKGGSDFTYVKGNFHPLSMISMTIDYALSPPAPPGTIPPVKASLFHFANLLFHLANTVLVFWLIYLLMSRFMAEAAHDRAGVLKNRETAIAVAAGTALLFGVHPLHVESVAWISERKDVLYAFFGLASLVTWLMYIRRPRPAWYLLTLGLFLLSLLSKAQAAFLPPVLMLLDFIAGRRLLAKKVLLEKAPFFLLAIGFGLIAVRAQVVGNAVPMAPEGLVRRIVYASIALTMYIVKTAVPTGLSTLYPYPDTSHGLAVYYYLAILPVLAVIAGILYGFRKSRALLFGLAFFAAAVFLILQLLPVGRAIMADRYMYLASIGLFFLVCYGVEKTDAKYRWTARSIVIACSLVLAGMTSSRCAIWNDSISLWDDAVAKCPTASIAWHNRAQVRFEKHNYCGAIEDETRAIKLEPSLADAYYNRANSKLTIGDARGSIEDNNLCLKYNPNHFLAYYLRGIAYETLGNLPAAISDYTESIRQNGGYPDCRFRRALAYARVNNKQAACDDFRIAAQQGNQAAGQQYRALCGRSDKVTE